MGFRRLTIQNYLFVFSLTCVTFSRFLPIRDIITTATATATATSATPTL